MSHSLSGKLDAHLICETIVPFRVLLANISSLQSQKIAIKAPGPTRYVATIASTVAFDQLIPVMPSLFKPYISRVDQKNAAEKTESSSIWKNNLIPSTKSKFKGCQNNAAPTWDQCGTKILKNWPADLHRMRLKQMAEIDAASLILARTEGRSAPTFWIMSSCVVSRTMNLRRT